MSHSHGHGPVDSGPPRPELARTLGGVVAAIAVATGIAMAILWPSSDDVPRDIDPFSGEGVTTVEATVTSLEPFDCGSTGEVDIDSMPTVAGSCANVTADVETGEAAGQTAEFQLNSTNFVAGTVAAGDRVRLVQYQIEGGSFGYEFRDFVRGFPLAALAIVFAVLVALIGRLRGLFALLGIGVTLVALMTFVLPGILTGQSPLLIAVVGSTGIMIAVLYLAHGISIRTTSALFGTLFGIAFTALAGLIGTDWSHLTGLTSEDDALLLATAPQLQMQGIVAASMVIAGLGVLNDVTVTQASAVWELRALQPFASAWDLFRSAMRIGRDHIASSVYTLVFAYAGSAMTVMLLITAYQRGLVDVLTSGEIAQEVVRTLVGAIGLVLAVPVTTAFAVWLAPPARDPGADREPDRAVDDSGSGATAPPATWADERPSAGRRVRRPEDA
ncbi:MAG: YibE/F family protein [Aeromicrobium sp.]|uniref:YibE/F family protein n=1 Tax=Aeromicrobium sp. TaxID=1871063 RepID=UPI0026206E55|nr:YibE/F family protein [Aeromicrobium sp.]MDF1704001.1 YibE/F family protein [Aeromicrobium sp.]